MTAERGGREEMTANDNKPHYPNFGDQLVHWQFEFAAYHWKGIEIDFLTQHLVNATDIIVAVDDAGIHIKREGNEQGVILDRYYVAAVMRAVRAGWR